MKTCLTFMKAITEININDRDNDFNDNVEQ